MQRSRPRREYAELYLRQYLAASDVARVPSVQQCARDAGVSYVTMWKAARSLRDSGELATIPAAPTVMGSTPRWEVFRQRLIGDIVSGRHAAGAEIGVKQMRGEYGVCYRTAAKALAWLETHGWLVRERRHYRVRSVRTGGSGATVVLLSTVDRTRSVETLTPRLRELVRACEIHCSRMRLGLEHVSLPRVRTVGSMRALSIPSGDDIAGYLVWMGDIGAESLRELLSRLAAVGKPVSVLDEVGDIAHERPSVPGAAIGYFSMANSINAGMAMGRHLLGLGHRSVGFVSVSRGQMWSDNRREGVAQALRAAGHAGAVRSYELRRHSASAELPEVLRGALDKGDISALVMETDTMAIECMTWLAQHGVVPGRELSVAGFDDTPEAFIHGLTSYNFNSEETIHAMLAHLAGRRAPLRAPGASIEVEGFVTPRGSTGRHA